MSDNPYVLPGDDQYSARLFGSPHQLSHLCDMRIDSMGDDKSKPGEVGNFYLNNVLKDAQLAYFTVGKARFTGGMNSIAEVLATTNAYMTAWNSYKAANVGYAGADEGSVDSTTDYDLAQYAKDDHTVTTTNTAQDTTEMSLLGSLADRLVDEEDFQYVIPSEASAAEIALDVADKATNVAAKAVGTDVGAVVGYIGGGKIQTAVVDTIEDVADGVKSAVNGISDFITGDDSDTTDTSNEATETIATSTGTDIFDQTEDGLYKYVEFPGEMSTISSSLGLGLAVLKTSLSVEQPMYSFESDWPTYINNVKTMIHTAAMMLGLQDAPILIGAGKYMKAGLGVKINDTANDVWANYRYMDTTGGAILEKDSLDGYTSQYIVFMTEPADSIQEQYTNTYAASQISGLMQTGNSFGNELAFITGSTSSAIDDTIIDLVNSATDAAETVLSNLSSGVGKFTAAIAGSMAKSYTGKHYIYPEIFSNYQTDGSTQTININLVASSGDPYTQFIDILVPTFFILGMAIPNQSKNNAASYDYPPLIQCNIPGKWGARLGAITSVTFTKSGQCKNGYPTNVKVSIQMKNLIPSLTTSSITDPSGFLNNNPMFDYIARRCGVDQCRPNGSIRLATKIMLAQNAVQNFGSNLRNAILSDVSSSINHLTKYSMF